MGKFQAKAGQFPVKVGTFPAKARKFPVKVGKFPAKMGKCPAKVGKKPTSLIDTLLAIKLTGLSLTKIIPNFAGNQKKMYVSLFSTNFRECHCFFHGSNH